MKNKQIIILISLIIFGLLGYFILIKDNSKSLINPSADTNSELSPTVELTPTPIIFKYNSSTDLKSELQSVNPKVEVSDFDKLKHIISTL